MRVMGGVSSLRSVAGLDLVLYIWNPVIRFAFSMVLIRRSLFVQLMVGDMSWLGRLIWMGLCMVKCLRGIGKQMRPSRWSDKMSHRGKPNRLLIHGVPSIVFPQPLIKRAL